MFSGGTTHASVVGPLNFESGTQAANQFTANFVQLYTRNSGTITQTDPADVSEPNNDYLRMQQNGNDSTTVIALNTSTTKTLANSDRFNGPFTLNFSLAADVPGGAGFAIYLFDPSSTNGADNLLVNLAFDQAGNQDRIRFSYDGRPDNGNTGTVYKVGANISGTGGFLSGGDGSADTYYAVDAITASTEASGTWTAASVAYTPGSNDDTTMTFTLGAASMTWTIPNDLRVSDPAIAFRTNIYNTGTKSWRIDNVQVVPEPTSMCLILGAGWLLSRRRR
jgi:hypothetical protein